MLGMAVFIMAMAYFVPLVAADHGVDATMIGRSTRARRRGSLLVEVAMATVLLMIAMTLTVKVLGFVALERRACERRQRAMLEVANLMERITAYPFDEVTPELAKAADALAGRAAVAARFRAGRRRRRQRAGPGPIRQADRDQAALARARRRVGGAGAPDFVDRTAEAKFMRRVVRRPQSPSQPAAASRSSRS